VLPGGAEGLGTVLGGVQRVDRPWLAALALLDAGHQVGGGASPEEIAQDYPVLQLDDVYAALTYYLRHREKVDAYLRERRSRAEAMRRERGPLRPDRPARQAPRPQRALAPILRLLADESGLRTASRRAGRRRIPACE
jgi:hypothetical protein